MTKNELKQLLIHKRMETKARLEIFKLIDPKKHSKELDELLDRLNAIDRILKSLDQE